MPSNKNVITRVISYAPNTLQEESRTVDIIISTADPIKEIDWKRGEYLDTVIHQEGIDYPTQVPMLDTHSRESADCVIGSIRNIHMENGNLVGTAHYASTERAETAFRLMREGHLTDYSIGARILQIAYVDRGKELKVGSSEYRADSEDLKIVTKSRLLEVSNCPIGADASAKVRGAAVEDENQEPLELNTNRQEDTMTGPINQEPILDRAAIEADVTRAETTRLKEVTALCERHQLNLAECVTLSVAEVTKRALDKAAEGLKPVQVTASHGGDPVEKFRANVEDAIMLRSGNGDWSNAKGVAKELAQRSLVDLCRESLLHEGKLDRNENTSQMINRALSTSDFPLVLANVANKSVKVGYDSQPETWRSFASTGSVRDFKINTVARTTSLNGSIQEIPEGGEYKALSRGEEQEQYGIKTYGGLLKITRQLIINDDLGQLTDSMTQLGEEMSLQVGDVVWNSFLSNPAMGDGVALFHASHGNVGTAAAPSEASLLEMWLAMQAQKENNKRLSIKPAFMLFPNSLMIVVEKIMNSMAWDATNKAATTANVIAQKLAGVERIYDQRLDEFNVELGTPSWYALGAKGKTVKAFFLNGVETPYMERETSFNNDTTTFKIRLDMGAKAMDYRTMYRNVGV